MGRRESVEKFAAMTVAELQETVEDLKDELFNLKMQLVTRTLERTSRIREVKREIARAMRTSPGADTVKEEI